MGSKKNSFISFFEYMLIVGGIILIISSAIYSIQGNDIWFSRFATGIICLGFSGVIMEIRKLRDKDE